jgi:hypothetical protein
MDHGRDFFEGYAFGSKGYQSFYIDSVGNYGRLPKKCFLVGAINSVIFYENDSSKIYSFVDEEVVKSLPGVIEFYDGLFVQQLKGKYSILDIEFNRLHTFNEILPATIGNRPLEYLGDSIFRFLTVSGPYRNIQFKLISARGDKLGDFSFDRIGEFSSGLAKYLTKNEFGEQKWGFVNTKGERIIPPKFSREPSDFIGNRAFIRYDSGEYGMINRKGIPVTKDIYDSYILLKNNRYFVVLDKNNEKLIVDSVGNTMKSLEKKTQYIRGKEENSELLLYRDYYLRLWGLMDFEGNQICSPKFNEIGPVISNRAYVTITNGEIERKGYINEKGHLVILFELDPDY